MKIINYIVTKSDHADIWEIGVFILCTAAAIAVLEYAFERVVCRVYHFLKQNGG